MKLAVNRAASEITGEKDIENRCLKLHKRNDIEPYGVIGVENTKGELRLRITCHTQAEEAGVTRYLEDRHFKNMTDVEEIDEEAGTIEGIYIEPPEGFDLIYRQVT